MIFRPSQKLSAKIRAGTPGVLPLDENVFADWSGHVFVADLTQYILLTNTKTLYSTVMDAKGIKDDKALIQSALCNLREFMEADGQAFVYNQFVAPASANVRFAKALDRSVTGCMSDLVYHAQIWLTKGNPSLSDVGFKLNDIPFSSLQYGKPREAFRAMLK